MKTFNDVWDTIDRINDYKHYFYPIVTNIHGSILNSIEISISEDNDKFVIYFARDNYCKHFMVAQIKHVQENTILFPIENERYVHNKKCELPNNIDISSEEFRLICNNVYGDIGNIIFHTLNVMAFS